MIDDRRNELNALWTQVYGTTQTYKALGSKGLRDASLTALANSLFGPLQDLPLAGLEQKYNEAMAKNYIDYSACGAEVIRYGMQVNGTLMHMISMATTPNIEVELKTIADNTLLEISELGKDIKMMSAKSIFIIDEEAAAIVEGVHKAFEPDMGTAPSDLAEAWGIVLEHEDNYISAMNKLGGLSVSHAELNLAYVSARAALSPSGNESDLIQRKSLAAGAFLERARDTLTMGTRHINYALGYGSLLAFRRN